MIAKTDTYHAMMGVESILNTRKQSRTRRKRRKTVGFTGKRTGKERAILRQKESKRITFIVNCEAIGKQRPKFAMRHGVPIAYTPKKTKEQESMIQAAFVNKFGMEFAEYEGCVSVEMQIGYRIPKSKSKKEKTTMLEDSLTVRSKPDIDNVIKLVLDALNGYAFKDDSQVGCVSAMKVWMTEPQTIIDLIYDDYYDVGEVE